MDRCLGGCYPCGPGSRQRDHRTPRRRRVVAAVFVACALHVGPAEAQGPSTPDERAHFVALVRLLETQPLGENANATRQRLREWVAEVPDIRFKVCADLLGQVLSGDYPYAREIALQVLLSGAVLTIEHPGEARDDVSVYTAGVEGALRAYEAMLKSTPNARLAALDDLVVRRDRGELVDYIARLANENCKRSNIFLIATPTGAAVGLVLALLVAHWFGGWRHVSARVATLFRRIVLICVAYYITALIALHFLEPEYDPRYHFMSDYAWGAYGWLMTTTFFVLGLGLLTVAVGLRGLHQSPRSARIGFGLLTIAAPFICLAGVFRGFPLHDVAGAVGIPSLVMAALLLSWSFRKAPEWQAIHPATFLIAVGMLAALMSMVLDIGMPGLQQRVLLSLLLLWLSIVVHRLVRVANGRVAIPQP